MKQMQVKMDHMQNEISDKLSKIAYNIERIGR